MQALDSQIRQVILDYLRQPSNQRGTQVNITNHLQTGLADICRKRVSGFTDVFVSALSNQTERDSLKRELAKARGIKQTYDAVWKRLTPHRKQLPPNLEESLEERLVSVFYQVRKIRNEAGHPTGYTPTAEEVHGNLILFPGYAELLYGLIQHLTRNRLT